MKKPSENLVKALAVTCELTGTDITQEAARVMVMDLSQFPEDQVLKALVKCRRELKGRMTIADVISRLEDGRPGPEEAWAMIPRDENSSVVWTTEMAEAFGLSCRHGDDVVAGRMVFIEAYKKRVQEARDAGRPVTWIPSLGHDPRGREAALMLAVEKGRMSPMRAMELLPHSASQVVVERIGAMGGEFTKRMLEVRKGAE